MAPSRLWVAEENGEDESLRCKMTKGDDPVSAKED